MKHAKFTTPLEEITFTGKTFRLACPDGVIRHGVTDYIQQHGGVLTFEPADYLIYVSGYWMEGDSIALTPIQFWLATRELDRIQQHEWVEASMAFLGSGTVFQEVHKEKILWFIRDNREKVAEEMIRQNVPEVVEGYLNHRAQILPATMTALAKTLELDDQILLDLVEDLLETATSLEKHEMKAWLLEYKRNHLSQDFQEENQQAELEKELGFRERNEYDWMKLFTYITEEDGIRISGYLGADDLVFIPDQIADKPVVSVHVRNFYAHDRDLQFFWQRPDYLNNPVDLDALNRAEVGDTVFFGMYPQTKASELQPIQWRVLKKEENRLLVVSTMCLDKAPYHRDLENVDWEHCHLRKWFNGPFYQLAFTPEEQAMIPEVTVVTEPNEKYKTPGGNDTQDRIFALSMDEAKLLPDNASRLGYTTAYQQVQGYYFGGKINCWWLRTPGVEPDFVTLVGNSGSIGTYGYRVDNNEYAVRPAMWIQLGGI